MFSNKNILVTGGTGSFGKKFISEILKKYKPKRLIVFSRDELKQFEMSRKINDIEFPCIRYFLGDVRDKIRLKIAMKDVDIVIHAAAMKQVGASEYNPTECIKTNIYGAENIIYASIESGVKKVIALSTDKAVNPINLYGASKLASEKLFIAANNISGKKSTRFSIVRYGNVISSRGSVVEVFENLLSSNAKYLPITDKRMTRFLISLEQGVNFVIYSIKIMKGGEVFIPKIPSIKIIDLADSMNSKIRKKIIGIQPGEKIHEVLFSHEEAKDIIEFKEHYVLAPSIIVSDNVSAFFLNKFGEKGKPLKNLFEYSSKLNSNILKKDHIKKIVKSDL